MLYCYVYIFKTIMVKLGNILIDNKNPFFLIGGINVIESEEMALDAAKIYKETCTKYKIPLIFKASFDKANRSSINSFRGLGIEKGLEILTKIRNQLDIPIITDVHEKEHVFQVAKVCEAIQLPAFLARQTDLIKEMALTGSVINIKKPQFSSPTQMKNIVEKFKAFGNNQVLLCERGTCFGYDNLVVDMLGLGVMKKECKNVPIIFDVTHSLQCRDSGAKASSGRRDQVFELARAAMSTGIAGLFLEAHQNPSEAKCDGPCALKLNDLDEFLFQMRSIDDLIKSFKK